MPPARDNAFFSGFAALLMLLYGWGVGLTGVTDSAFYNTSVDLFTWTLRLGGLCLLAASLLGFLEMPIGLLLDAVLSALCGTIMLACSLTWLIWESTHGMALSLNGFLFIIFGVIFLRTAAVNWTAWRSGECTASAPAAPPQPGLPPPPPHPAGIRPKSLSSETPPPGGYLAALSKEEEEPPSASYE